jgi:hypothetical protein
MNKRPISVTIISWIFIAIGVVTLAYELSELKGHSFQSDDVWVGVVRFTAIVCGAFMLRGSNWARWLTMAWLAFHVVLSAFNSWHELAVHTALAAVFAYFLFRAPANEYFRAKGSS